MESMIEQSFFDCCDLLDSIGLHVQRDKLLELRVSSRLKSVWGKCCSKPNGFIITINASLLKESVPPESLQETMLHELLHSITPGDHHGGKWARNAARVRRELGIDIKRCASQAEKQAKLAEPKYICQCEKCGATIGRHKMTGFVEHPGLYVHPECGGHFRRIK